MPEIFDIKSTLETTSEESSERRGKRCESSHDKKMEVVRGIAYIRQMESDL